MAHARDREARVNGPPNGKPPNDDCGIGAAQESTHTPILSDEDELCKFAELQQRAGRAGYVLRRSTIGYLLLKGCTSFHSSSLDAVLHYIVREGVRT